MRTPFCRVRNEGETWSIERVWSLGAVPETVASGVRLYSSAVTIAELLDADLALDLAQRAQQAELARQDGE